MAPPTNQQLNQSREENCVSVTPERKYYRVGDTWIKRSLRPHEWQKHNGYMHVPKFNGERILNEGACLAYLAANTDVPVPKVHACPEDDGAVYLITEYIEGVGMNELDEDKQKTVSLELENYLEELGSLKSNTWRFGVRYVVPAFRRYQP
jgi:hypothetical protein